MKLEFLIVFLVFFYSSIFSQESNYVPLNSKCMGEELILGLDEKLEKDIEGIPTGQKAVISSIYMERVNSIKENIENEHYLFDSPINHLLDKILLKILSANPEIPASEINLFISRYPSPNASCLGEGSIVFNIGLIRRLENEDQIAFVLCHELAHYIAGHVNKNIAENVNKIEGLEEDKALKRIKKSKYNRREQLLEIIQGLQYKNRYHSRLNETEADSLGMDFFLNTGFDPQEALTCMLLLDQLDRDKYPKPIAFKKWFNFPDYPFKSRWLLERKKGLSKMRVDTDQDLIDTLKTHPDCQLRHKFLSQQIEMADLGLGDGYENQELKFDTITKLADFEIVESYFDFQNYGRSLFHALQLLEKYPDNIYLRSRIGFSLYSIYRAQENHKMYDYVDNVKSQKPNYKQLLQFVHNLRLDELRKITFYFLQQDEYRLVEDEDYSFVLWLSALEMGMDDYANKIKTEYGAKYPNGKYLDHFEE